MSSQKGYKLVDVFDFEEGQILAQKYEVLQPLGVGWEGEVYLVRELETGIERAAKFFYPKRNKNNTTLKVYAKKLHKLRHCGALIQYYTQDHIVVEGERVPFLVSEYVEGELLSDLVASFPGHRMMPFQALHLLYALVQGLEEIHRLKEYHGDLHPGNVIVTRYGLRFDVKLVDLFHWKENTTPQNMQDDIIDVIRLFHHVMGGAVWYQKHPDLVKDICCGLKRNLILKKFRSASKLRIFLENAEW